MNWRRLGEVAAGSTVLFVVLPLLIKRLGASFTDGVLIGTGVAIVWYTVETLYLRRETAHQNEIAGKQNEIGTEQNLIALEQAQTAIRPLLVSRIEPHLTSAIFVLRNIGHGPALFVQIQPFTVRHSGSWTVRVFPVDLIEPGQFGVPRVEVHPVEGQGEQLDYEEFINSLMGPPAIRAEDQYEITINYEDVQRRRFQSVMEMGLGGTRLLTFGPT